MPTPSTFQTIMNVYKGIAAAVDKNGYIANIAYLRKIVSKTAAYTCLVSESGTEFNTLGATQAIVFTLPAVASSAGIEFRFVNAVNYNMTVTAPSGTLVAKNNAGATSIAYSTTSKLIGQSVTVTCDGAKWYASGAFWTDASIT